MIKILKIFSFSIIFSFALGILFQTVSLKNVQAATAKQVTIVHPIRGQDFWSYNYSLLETPRNQYQLLQQQNLSATWLVRYDALVNPEVVAFLKTLNPKQEIGIFMEITPTFAQSAGVKYNQSQNWHWARSALLVGYSPEDRQKLIDKSFTEYKNIFGVFPKSVGAWWIDADSLSYMKDKYDIEANMDVADQYSTDQYQVWGQYFSLPFYPAKSNALFPAPAVDKKIDLVTIQWAIRDPYNSYGSGAYDSTYSVQANDYLLHDLDTSYFEALLNIFPQITVGIENDFDWIQFGAEYANQLKLIKQKSDQGLVQVKTMSQFYQFYKSQNPTISPSHLLISDDPLKSGGKVVWYQTTKYRIGWFYIPNRGSLIRDLHIYDEGFKEPCLDKACSELNLAKTFVNAIDEVTYKNSWVISEGRVSDIKVTEFGDQVEISYKNQAGDVNTLKFLPNDIEVNGRVVTLSSATIEAQKQKVDQLKNKQSLYSDYSTNFNLINLLINFAKFIFVSILFFFLPGLVLTRNKLLSIPVGWVVVTLVSYLMGLLNIPLSNWLLWGLVSGNLFMVYRLKLIKLGEINFNKHWILPFVIILFGSLLWGTTVFKSGLEYSYGYGFWGPNGHDAIWHLSLISELQRNIPPQNPVFAGEQLKNYHYFFDLLIAKTGQFLTINSQDLLFRFYPMVIAVLIGILTFSFVKKISSTKAAFFSLFFIYFGGSFGYIASFIKEKSILDGESAFWSQQSISTLLNPPFAISLVFLLTGLILLTKFLDQEKNSFKDLWKTKSWRGINLLNFISLGFIFGVLIEFKAYAGVLVMGALGLFTLDRMVFKRDFLLLPLLIVSGLISLLVFLPNNLQSGGILVFSPFWFIQSMIDFPDRLGWERLSLAIHSETIFKSTTAITIGLLIFLVGNIGTRIFSLFSVKEFFKQRYLTYIVILGVVLPLLFIQTGTNWNTIQFLYYSLFLLNIFAGIALSRIYSKLPKVISTLMIGLILLLTIPTTLGAFKHYLPSRPPAMLPNGEIEALYFLKKQPLGVVLTYPYNKEAKLKFDAPVPLFAYESTSYVSAYSGKPSYLEDLVNLEILGVDYKARTNIARDFFNLKEKSKSVINNNNIQYIYVVRESGFEEDASKMGIEKIFENDQVKIFKKS